MAKRKLSSSNDDIVWVKCQICGQTVREGSFRDHKYSKHGRKSGPMWCAGSTCKRMLTGERCLKNHQKICKSFKKEGGKCPVEACNVEPFLQWEKLASHIKTRHPEFEDVDGYLDEPEDYAAVIEAHQQTLVQSLPQPPQKMYPAPLPSSSSSSSSCSSQETPTHTSINDSALVAISPPPVFPNIFSTTFSFLTCPILDGAKITQLPQACKNEHLEGFRRSILIEIKDMIGFRSFQALVSFMFKNQLDECGAIVIRPPKSYCPTRTQETRRNLENMLIKKGLKVDSIKRSDTSKCILINHKTPAVNKTVSQLREEKQLKDPSPELTPKELNENFWTAVKDGSLVNQEYASGIEGTGFDKLMDGINMDKLGDDLRSFPVYYYNQQPKELPGITTSMMYFGELNSEFTMHCEDFDLGSVSYLHEGASKVWWVIPPRFGRNLEEKVAQSFPNESQICPAMIRHKNCMIPTEQLDDWGIPFNEIEHQPGDFVLLAPRAYHQGYNRGWNIAQATNYSTAETYPFVKCHSTYECVCKQEPLQLFLQNMVMKYEPERLEEYNNGLLKCTNPIPGFKGQVTVLDDHRKHDEYYNKHDQVRKNKEAFDPSTGKYFSRTYTRAAYGGPLLEEAQLEKKKTTPSSQKKSLRVRKSHEVAHNSESKNDSDKTRQNRSKRLCK